MASGPDPTRRPGVPPRRGPLVERDPSMQARKSQLFEDEDLPTAAATAPRGRPFAEYLRETPAAPLPAWLKAALGAAAVAVALLLVAGLLRLAGPKPAKTRATAVAAPAVLTPA